MLDDSSDKIAYKIRMAHTKKVPYQAVIGAREIETGTVTVKAREGDLGALDVDAFIAKIKAESVVPF